MKDYPLVSIALCTYNGEKFLEQQLDTLISQTYPNIEIIAIDDCSHDDTFSILSNYALKNNNFCIYRNETNLGFTRNFELALTYCKGELIACCDQDDLWDSRKIEIQVAAIDNHQLIYHDSEFINDRNESLHKKMSDMFNFYRGDNSAAFLFFNCVSGHSMLIRKEVVVNALPLKEGYYHDWWIAYVATNGGTIDYIPQCLVKYRQHEQSDTDLLKVKKAENDKHRHIEVVKIYNQRAKWLMLCAAYKKNKAPEFIQQLSYLYRNRLNQYLSIRLFILLKKHSDILYFIQKKSGSQKKKNIIKLLWGYKAKNFWYTHIKPDKRKIVYLEE